MDIFIPNMTLANIMHSNSNILPFPFILVHTLSDSLATVSPSTTLTLFERW